MNGLCSWLADNKSVKRLTLDSNEFGYEGLKILVHALSLNFTNGGCIEYLSIQNVAVSDHTYKMFYPMIQSNKKIHEMLYTLKKIEN